MARGFEDEIGEGFPFWKSLCYAKLREDPLVLNSVIPNKDFLFPFLSLQWLNEAKIIQRLVELIHSSQDEDVSMGGLSSVSLGGGSCKVQKNLSSLP